MRAACCSWKGPTHQAWSVPGSPSRLPGRPEAPGRLVPGVHVRERHPGLGARPPNAVVNGHVWSGSQWVPAGSPSGPAQGARPPTAPQATRAPDVPRPPVRSVSVLQGPPSQKGPAPTPRLNVLQVAGISLAVGMVALGIISNAIGGRGAGVSASPPGLGPTPASATRTPTQARTTAAPTPRATEPQTTAPELPVGQTSGSSRPPIRTGWTVGPPSGS